MKHEELALLALLGYVFLQNARPDKAMAVLAALDRITPGQSATLRALAVAQVRAGKPERALDTLNRLAMSGGVDAAFHLLRGQALSLIGHHEEAFLAMQNYMQTREHSAGALEAHQHGE